MMEILESLEARLRVNDEDWKPSHPTVIVPLDYGTLTDELFVGTRECLFSAFYCARMSQTNPVIAYANSDHCFAGSDTFASKEKLELARSEGFPMERVIDAGGASNSVLEARRIKEVLLEKGVDLSEILLIADNIHARSVLFIWKRVFPETRLSLECIPTRLAYRDNSLFLYQRTRERWIVSNAMRYAALRIFGLELVSNFKHRPQP
jgi:hypothetical protein